jgi:glycine/D-amino acid oxidase-like deaminating enzyme
MTRLRLGRSYWLDVSRRKEPSLPPLRGGHRADVAIVGGGLTGCAAALLFARAGASVVLVESQHIGRGSSAASTALLMQEPDVDLGDLAARYGPARSRRMWGCSASAVAAMRRTLTAMGAPSLHALPSLYVTRDPKQTAPLRHEAELRQRAGFRSRWIEPRAVHRLTGFETAGAIRTDGNAQADPYGACLALAAGARRAGARLYERSAVRRVAGTRHGVAVALADGEVHADWAIIATGYATPAFKPLASRFRMMNTYVVATPRLRPSQRRALGLGDVMLWDTERPYHYLRWTPDHRLLFGGLDRPRVPRATRPTALRAQAVRLMADLADLFPSLSEMRAEYAWEGLFATTPDGLPYVGAHRRYPRHLFALGYGGNGMTLGFLAAQVLVRIASGTATADDELFGFGRMRSARRAGPD